MLRRFCTTTIATRNLPRYSSLYNVVKRSIVFDADKYAREEQEEREEYDKKISQMKYEQKHRAIVMFSEREIFYTSYLSDGLYGDDTPITDDMLIWVIENGDLNLLQKLMTNIGIVNEPKHLLLYKACFNNKLDIVKYLMTFDCCKRHFLDKGFISDLYKYSIEEDNMEMIDYLLDVNIGESAIKVIMEKEHIDTIHLIKEKGLLTRYITDLMVLLCTKLDVRNKEIFDFIEENHSYSYIVSLPYDTLLCAIDANNVEMFEAVFYDNRLADINIIMKSKSKYKIIREIDPVRSCIRNNNLDMLKLLAAKGLDFHAGNYLNYAIETGKENIDMVYYLIREGQISDYYIGQLLDIAVSNDNYQVVERFIDDGMVNGITSNICEIAVNNGSYHTCKALRDRGASFTFMTPERVRQQDMNMWRDINMIKFLVENLRCNVLDIIVNKQFNEVLTESVRSHALIYLLNHMIEKGPNFDSDGSLPEFKK